MSKELDKLIEQVLNEVTVKLPYDLEDATGKKKTARAVKNDLGVRLGIGDIRKLADKDDDAASLAKTDFQKVYGKKGKDSYFDAAEEFRTASNVSGDVEDVYNSSTYKQNQDTLAANLKKKIDDAVDAIETKPKVSEKWEEFVKQTDADSDLKKRVNKHEVFKGAFPQDEWMQILALSRVRPTPKISTKGQVAIQRDLESAEITLVDAELQGSSTKGYSRYITTQIKGDAALAYYAGTSTQPANYNYTVYSNPGSPVQPWFLDGGEENLNRIKNLLNDFSAAGVKNYLEAFYADKSEDKQFIHNLKVFQKAIQDKNIPTKDTSTGVGQWWTNMVSRYQDITKTDPDTKGGLKRTAVTDQPFMSQAAGTGEMLDSQFSMFKTFFEGTDTGSSLQTLSARIKKLTDFTKKLYDVGASTGTITEVADKSFWGLTSADSKLFDRKDSQNEYVEYLNKIMIFDYFNAMAKELDSGSGPYVFEAFCAYMAGGRVAGKEKGLKGGMGETDFLFDNGDKGSAKYLRAKTKFSQSVDNFLQGVKVTYVFAAKKGEKPIYNKTSGELADFEAGKEVGQSDPDLIHFIDIYVVDVMRLEQKFDGDTVRFKIESATKPAPRQDKDGNVVNYDKSQDLDLKIKETHVEFDVSTFDPVGRVYLVQKDKKSLMDKLSVLADSMDKDTAHAQNQFKALTENFLKTFEHLGAAREKVSKYSNTGDMNVGKDAKDDMSKAGNQFDQVMTIVDSGKPLAAAVENRTRGVDSLIESIVKKMLIK